jgi:hypothetical protein
MKKIKETNCNNNHKSRFNLKSIEDIWYSIIVFIIQIICINKSWINLVKYNRQSWLPNQKPNSQIYFYIICLMANICLLPLFLFTCLFKLGLYANDRFKFGFDLDSNKIKLNETSRLKKHGFRNDHIDKSYVKSIFKFVLSKMPISNLIHLTMSFCLVLPNVLMISKEIEYGLRPKANVYHTELDFLFSRPLKRFSESISINLDPSYLLKNLKYSNQNLKLNLINNNNLKYQLIASSLNDINEINYMPSMSIELLNYFIALTFFSFNYSQAFWHLNKLYTFLFSIHLILFSILSVLSLSAFEILFKFQTVFYNGIKLSINTTNGSMSTNDDILYKIPFFTSPNLLLFLYLIGSLAFLFSSLPLYSFGIYQYKIKLTKLRHILLFHIKSNIQKINQLTAQQNTNNLKANVINILSEQADFKSTNVYSSLLANRNIIYENTTPEEDMSVMNRLLRHLSPSTLRRNHMMRQSCNQPIIKKAYSSLSIQISSSMASTSSTSSPASLLRFIFKSHKYHLFAFLTLIFICLNSLFIFYDYLCLYQLTSDIILFYAILFKFFFLCWYLIVWLLLSFKLEWDFEFNNLFKLNYWHHLNKQAIMSNSFNSIMMTTLNNKNENTSNESNTSSTSNNITHSVSSNNNNNEYSTASQTPSVTNFDPNQYYLNEDLINSIRNNNNNNHNNNNNNLNNGTFSFKNKFVKHSISTPSVTNIVNGQTNVIKTNLFPTDLYTANENANDNEEYAKYEIEEEEEEVEAEEEKKLNQQQNLIDERKFFSMIFKSSG